MLLHSVSRTALVLVSMAGAVSFHATPALAQAPAPSSSRDASTQKTDGDAIIVTGRAGSDELKKVETSYAISTISEEDLEMRAPQGMAEALKAVPGFWIENTGGEGSGNLRVRGIPTDGYSSVGVLEDGLPVQADAGLGWLNADQSVRMDQTIQRIEVVRGGPSSIFYSNAPGAVINMITKRGGDTFEGLVRYEVADYNMHRVDAQVSGPIGSSDWRYFAGGYYRIGDGPRDTGYQGYKGGQGRLTISRDFDRGSIMLGVKRIDETMPNAQGGIFYTNSDGDPEAVPGYDSQHGVLAGSDTRHFTFPSADGDYEFDQGVGTRVKLTQLTFEGTYELTDSIRVEHRSRYRDSWTRRNSITPYSVANASDLINSVYGSYVPDGLDLGLYYTNSGEAFDFDNQNGNGLAVVDLARSYTTPLEEFTTDTRFLGELDALGHHNWAIGGYFAKVNEKLAANTAAILTDVKDNAELLDVYLVDAAGNKYYQFTQGGVMQYGAEFYNAMGSSETLAFYASDEWEVTDKLRIDGGLRWEQIATNGRSETATTIALEDNAVGSATVGSGEYEYFSGKYDSTAWTLGANYQFQPDLGVFVRYTDTFRLPNISSNITNVDNVPVTQKMHFLEAGLKFSRPHFNFYLTGFQSVYESYEISDYKENAAGTLVLTTVYGDTKTRGVEAEGYWSPVNWFDLRANWTYQDARFTDFVYTNSSGNQVDYSHNRLIRVPENVVRVTPGLNFLRDRLRVESTIGYYGQRYADVANQVNLPAYWQIDLNAKFDLTDQLQFNLYVTNLTDELGLASGNPRQGSIENNEAGDSVYIANSILGRTVRAAVAFKF